MCYYEEWDEQVRQAANAIRKSKEQAEQMLAKARQAVTSSEPKPAAAPEKQRTDELEETSA